MANFTSADAARKRYNEIASGLLDTDAAGTRFGHNQIGLGANNQFSAFDLQYKKGDPSSLAKGGNNVASALNNLVKEFGLDASKIEAQKVGNYEALGSVRYDPGAGVKRSERAAFDEIFNKYLKGQFDSKIGGLGAAPAPVAAPARAAAPVNPNNYGQPARPVATPGAQPVGIRDDGPNPFPQQNNAPMAPRENMTPGTPERPTPGWQGPERRYNDLPTGPSLVQNVAVATSGRDPYMAYLAPVYRPVKTGDEAYDEMGLDLLARYGFGAEHNFFPNRDGFNI